MNGQDLMNNQKSLRKAIYEELKEEILYGQRPPGMRLMELELSKEKGASRTPIREAIKMLADDGLVKIIPNRGAYVTKISIQELMEILEVREEIDGMSAYYAAERVTDSLLVELRKAMEKCKEAFDRGDRHDIVFWDTDFHDVIVRGTQNQVLINLVSQLREELLRFRHIYYGDFRKNHDIVSDHEALYKEIANGDAQNARKLAKEHMRDIMRGIVLEYNLETRDNKI